MTAPPRAFVIGHPIAQSRSPLIHGYWLHEFGLPGSYEKIEVAPEALPGFVDALRAGRFVRGNVTVPHKTAVMRLVDALDPAAEAIGAVNTLWFEDGRLHGGNTDAAGFIRNLDDEAPGWDRQARHATVLGAGGAARAVLFGLLGRGLSVTVVNRTPERAAELARHFGPAVSVVTDAREVLADTDLLVNTTSLGMSGKPLLDVDLSRLKPEAVVNDIVYVPLETDLLRQARRRGHPVVGGLGMLLHQAVPGFARWFGRTPVVTPALRRLIEDDVRAASP